MKNQHYVLPKANVAVCECLTERERERERRGEGETETERDKDRLVTITIHLFCYIQVCLFWYLVPEKPPYEKLHTLQYDEYPPFDIAAICKRSEMKYFHPDQTMAYSNI